MYETISTKGMSRGQWLELRRTGIGGSDAGAVCGLNPYGSAMSVFCDKIGNGREVEDNEAMRQGRDLEDYVARRFCEATGLKVRRSNKMYRSKENPFMIADVDRLLVGQDAGLECKTASAYNGDKWKAGKIPPHYLIQCCHYMAVTGKKEWYIAVAILGREFKYVKIPRNEELIQDLIAVEREFWTRHVLSGVMPDPDGSEACDRVLGQYFKTARKGSAVRLEGFDEKLRRREEAAEQIRELRREQKQIEQEVKLYMKDHEAAFSDAYRVSWSSVETVRLDSGRIKEERPDIYKKFASATSSRRFTVKAA